MEFKTVEELELLGKEDLLDVYDKVRNKMSFYNAGEGSNYSSETRHVL